MKLLTDGTWPCTIIDGGAFDDGGVITVRINVQISDGPDKGRRTMYEDQVNAKSSPYVLRSCKAVGWKGQSLTTLTEDIVAAVKAGKAQSTVEIRHVEIKRGKKFDAWVAAGSKPQDKPIWDKANSIGSGPKPLPPARGEALADADEAMRRAMADFGDEPALGGGAVPEDEIPFASCALNCDVNPIATVLR